MALTVWRRAMRTELPAWLPIVVAGPTKRDVSAGVRRRQGAPRRATAEHRDGPREARHIRHRMRHARKDASWTRRVRERECGRARDRGFVQADAIRGDGDRRSADGGEPIDEEVRLDARYG